SVRPAGFFQSSMSRCMFTSCGIQWFAQPARYFSHAQRYLNGTSWLTSAWPLMTRLSSTRTRRKPLSSACRSTSGSRTDSRARMPPAAACIRAEAGGGGAAGMRGAGAVKSSSKLSMWGSRGSSLCVRGEPGPLHRVRAVPAGSVPAGEARGPLLVHRVELVVEKLRREILAVEPGDRREAVVEIELREPVAVAQRLERLAVQLVGEIDHAFASVVEFQPDLVVTEIACIHHVSGCVLVPGQH